MEHPQIAPSKEVAAATGVKRKSKLKSRGGGQGNGSRCDGTSVLEKVAANNDDAMTIATKSSLSNNSNITAPVTPGGGGGQHDKTTFANNAAIDLTCNTPTKKVASEDHFLLSPVVEIVSKPATTTTSLPINDSKSNSNSKRKRVSTSPTSLEKSSNNDVEKKKKKKKKKKPLQGEDTSNAPSVSAASSKQKKSKDGDGVDKNIKPSAATTSANAPTNVNSAATSKKSSPTPTKQPPKKKIKKRSFHDQILFTMLTSNKPYNLKSLAKATKTTVEQLNHAMLSFIDKGLVVVKEFPGKNGKEGKKLYWATTVTLSDNNDGTKKQKKGSDGAIQKELSKILATPGEIQEMSEMHTKLEQQYKSIQDELQPLLKIPTNKGLDDDIKAEEEKLKSVQNEIDAIRTRIREQSEKKPQQVSKPAIQYGGYLRMMNQQKRNAALSQPPNPTTLKRKINYMLSEYKGRKRKCMDFVNELADAMEKHPREVMNNEKILGLDTDEMEWGWWLDCSSGKVFGKKPKVQKKTLLGGRGRYGAGAKQQEEQEEGKDEPTIKIPAKYVDI